MLRVRTVPALLLTTISLLFATALFAQTPADEAAKPAAKSAKDADLKAEPPAPVIEHHQISIHGQTYHYTTTTGLMPLKNSKAEVEATVFFMAYTLDRADKDNTRRPLTFTFNGGPGSASVWLHLGTVGPRRIHMQPEGFMPAPPYQVSDNENTWLPETDLVFIDPVGTGYSRAAKPELITKFLGVREDTAAVGEFIRMYLSRYERWNSPLFLAGESYGTTRASNLSGYLLRHDGIAFNGIILMSAVLNFETLEFVPGNDLPYVLYLPSYTAAAWYHKKLDPSLLSDLQSTLRLSEQFASCPYAEALAKGDRLTPAERSTILDQLARFTGLSKSYLDLSDLRVEQGHFDKELLRDQHRSAGRLDARFTGIEPPYVDQESQSDPANDAIRAPFSSAFNQYVRTELGYKTDDTYYLLGGGFSFDQWNWGNKGFGLANTDVSGSLRAAFAQNQFMRLFVASGYYDLATPYFATEYTLAHLGLEPAERARISLGYYDAGHMMYLRDASSKQLHDDVAKFINSSLSK